MNSEKIINWINGLKNSGKLVIVEGEKDKLALSKLGIKNVVAISRKPLFSFVEEISKKHMEIVILTDLDSEGRRLYSTLRRDFQKNGIRVDRKFREILFKETKISQIEGIFRYFTRNFSVLAGKSFP
ncbi:MAG: toprim domain-containing protein [Candidatus Nanoarchaeia archaeon]